MQYSIPGIAAIVNDPRAGNRVFAIEAQPGQRSQVAALLASLIPQSEKIALNDSSPTRAWLSDAPMVIDYHTGPGAQRYSRDLLMAIYEERVTNAIIVFERDAGANRDGVDGIPIPPLWLSRMVWLVAEPVV